jgi:Tat protein secretion system quality control protein TatD with DNase activity
MHFCSIISTNKRKTHAQIEIIEQKCILEETDVQIETIEQRYKQEENTRTDRNN